MTSLKILRNSYRKLPQNALATYAENVIVRCDGNAVYAAVQSFITELKPASAIYQDALRAASNRGSDTVARKNQARQNVLDQLDRIAQILELNNFDEAVVVNAGFKAASARQSFRGAISTPESLRLFPTGNSGELSVQFRIPERAHVRMNALEYSLDQGENWKNGVYQSRNKARLTGLPSGQSVLVRVRSIGANGQLSAWTAPQGQYII